MEHTSILEIIDFKSIRKLAIKPKRINLFLGEPNAGKTNILEALAFLSQNIQSDDSLSKEIFRYKTIANFFPDSDLSKCPLITTSNLFASLVFPKSDDGSIMNKFKLSFGGNSIDKKLPFTEFLQNGQILNNSFESFSTNFRFYSYKSLYQFTQSFLPHLQPPHGSNITNLLLSNTDFRKEISSFFKSKGFLLQLRPDSQEIDLAKQVDDIIYSYPYISISETLKRIVFMKLAIMSNENSVLIFDEPEANFFPFYVKEFSEQIALNNSNQYFMTTHNPYLLLNIIEKTPSEDLAIFICRMENYETKTYEMSQTKISEMFEMGSDVFYNLDNLIAE